MKAKKILSSLIVMMMLLTNVVSFAEEVDLTAETETTVTEEATNESNEEETPVEELEIGEAAAEEDGVIDTEAELAAALAAGGEVTLGGDIAVNTMIEISSGVTATLDLAGYAITSGYQVGSDSKHIYPLDNYGTLTIKDSKGTGSITGRGIYVQEGSKLTVEGGAIYGIDSNGGSALFQYGGDIVINGGLIEQKAEGTYNFAINAGGGTVIVNGGKIAGNHGAIAAVGADVVINDGEFVCTGSAGLTDNVLYSSDSGELTVNGGTFIADNDSSSGGCCVYDSNGGATINGGDFSNSSGGDVWGTTGTTINGGTFGNLTETQHVAVGATITNGGVTYTMTENGLEEVVIAQVSTYEELVAALEEGKAVVLADDITATNGINGTDANIDLGGYTLTLTTGGTNFFGDSTIANGKIDITGCVASGDCIIGIGDYSNSATLTLNNVNIVGDEYSSAYAVLYVYNSSTLNINGGSIVVSNDSASAGGVIKAHSAANGKINITGTEEDPVELTFTDAKIGILDGTVVMDYVDLDITGGANAINQSALTVKNSTLTIKDCDGRALTLSQGDIIVENSTLDFSGATEGEIRFKKALTLNVDENSEIKACTIWSDVEGANVNGEIVEGTATEHSMVTVKDGVTIVKNVVTGLEGEGTEASPYLINNLDELIWFRDSVNTYASDGSNQYKGKYVKLTADINLYGINWEPIGTNSVGDHMAFLGTFDGDGHTISNLYVNADGDHLGFFARVGSYAEVVTPTVKNITFNNVDVSSNTTTGHGGSYVGGVIANAGGNSVVENITVTGYVYVAGYGYIGGIVGHGYPDLTNCHVNANDGSYVHSYYWCVGGIIGYAGEGATPITNCSVSGLDIWGAKGGAAAVAGLLQDGNTLTNVSASNVKITSASDYCMGYIAGNGEASTLTNVTVSNVTATANGKEITSTDAVASVGTAIYFDLQSAFEAATEGVTITVLKDVTLSDTITIAKDKNITLDLNGKTVSMSVAATKTSALITNNGTLTIKDSGENGKLTYVSSTVSTAYSTTTIINNGTLTVESGIIENTSARGGAAYAIDSYNTLTVNGGTITTDNTTAIRQAQFGNYDNSVTVTDGTITGGYAGMQVHVFSNEKKTTTNIKGGTFKGVYACYTTFYNIVDSSNTAVNISGGTFDGAVYLYNSNKGSDQYGLNMSVTGGEFKSEDVYVYTNDADGNDIPVKAISGGTFSAKIEDTYLAKGYATVSDGNGSYSVHKAPNATVTLLESMTLTPEEHDYMVWPSGDDTIDRSLEVVMNFKANETLEDAQNGAFGKWKTDFYVTVTGLANGSFTATDDCYLAGNYGTYGWIVIPLDGTTIEEGVSYPVVSGYDENLTYENICDYVKDFTAAIHVDPAILIANPNFKLELSLKMTNPNDAENVLVVGEPAVYTAEDLISVDLPTATVTPIEKDDLTFALNFKADEVTDTQLTYYGNWYADFVLTINKDVKFNANGGADGYLSGQYDEWSENWVNVPFENVTMKAGKSLKIMEYAAELMGKTGLKYTYAEVYEAVKDFNCGVFFTPEFLAANPDLEVTLELRMYNPDDESVSYAIGETYKFDSPTPVLTLTTETVKAENICDTFTLFVASYADAEETKLVDVEAVSISSEYTGNISDLVKTDGAVKVKAYIWNSDMSYACHAKTASFKNTSVE